MVIIFRSNNYYGQRYHEMSTITFTREIEALLNSVTAKRPRTVIEHIRKYGYITSDELKDIYGYNHPPRAIRDVRELGIPIDTYRIKGKDKRYIAAYKFGNFTNADINLNKSAGRTALTKALKQSLIEKYGAQCFIYLEHMSENLLQVDHRAPYEIHGEQDINNIDNFMLLSPSANRLKSWSCEHCKNWIIKDNSFCVKCFWAYPDNYEHIAGKFEKIITITFTEDEIADYENLINIHGRANATKKIKDLIHSYLSQVK